MEFLHFDLRLHSTRTYIRPMLAEYAHAARSSHGVLLSLARQETQSAIVNRASKSMGIAYLFICKFVT